MASGRGEERSIRQIVVVASLVCVGLAVPRTLFAAPNLALPHSDYPGKSKVAVLPATNHIADQYFGPVHRSSFDALHRIDGAGWVQAAVWHFMTGRGGARRTHQTVFAYAINVYHSKTQAQRAVSNVKIKTVPYRVHKIYSRLYQHSDGKETLVFLFFSCKSVEVEAYYEYRGTAPVSTATALRGLFNRQANHLAGAARKLNRSISNPPPPPATATPAIEATDTPAATAEPATATPTVVAGTPTSTSVPPTVTPVPSPTPTLTPVPALTITAQVSSSTYAPGSDVTVTAHVSLGDRPASGANVSMAFPFSESPAFCTTATDSSGTATCTVTIPANTPSNSLVDVSITADMPGSPEARATVTFTVGG